MNPLIGSEAKMISPAGSFYGSGPKLVMLAKRSPPSSALTREYAYTWPALSPNSDSQIQRIDVSPVGVSIR